MTDVTETAKRLRRAAAQQARYHAERDELIRQARAEGLGVREIARLVGMTHPGVLAILGRGDEGRVFGPNVQCTECGWTARLDGAALAVTMGESGVSPPLCECGAPIRAFRLAAESTSV